MHNVGSFAAEQRSQLTVYPSIPYRALRHLQSTHLVDRVVVYRKTQNCVAAGFQQPRLLLEGLVFASRLLIGIVAEQDLLQGSIMDYGSKVWSWRACL